MKKSFFSFANFSNSFSSAAFEVVAFSHRTCLPAVRASRAFS